MNSTVQFINQLLFLVLLAEHRLFLSGLFASFGFPSLTLHLSWRFDSGCFFIDGFNGKYTINAQNSRKNKVLRLINSLIYIVVLLGSELLRRYEITR